MIKKEHLLFLGAVIGIVALYFFLRIYNILSLPIFTDEAIYIRWAQIAKQDAAWRFISLTDGKQPFFIWVAIIFLKFIADPLLAVRLVSVAAGFATTVGLFFLGNEIFREQAAKLKIFSFTKKTVTIGLLSSLFYVLYPFGLVYDRMALYDSMVGSFAVWSLYLLFLFVRTLRLDVALISGLVIGGGMLTKTNAFFSLYSIPLLLLIFDWKEKHIFKRFLQFISLAVVIAVLSYGMYSVLRLSPYFHVIAEKNALFVYPFSEWIKHPFTYLQSNLQRSIEWFVIYFTIPAIVLALWSFFISKNFLREKILLVLWFAFPFIALVLFGNTIYPRYFLFMTLPLIPLVSYTLVVLFYKYENPALKIISTVILFGWFIIMDYFIIADFAHAPIPKEDTGQYLNSWSAGNGVLQSVNFFKKEAADKKIYIMTQGTFGLMPFGLEMYLVDNPNIKIKAVWPISDTPPQEVIAAAKKMPTYAIFYQECSACGENIGDTPKLWKVEKIASYRQGTSDAEYVIYKILP